MADKRVIEGGYEIRRFDSDFDTLHNLIYTSWRMDTKRSAVFLDYNAKWLEWNLRAPDADRDLQIAAYKNDELVGFLCMLPRMVYYKNQRIIPAMIGTLLTVHPGHRRRRIAWNMAEYTKDIVFSKGKYKLMLGYLYSRRASAPLLRKLVRRYSPYGVRFEILFRAKHMVKVLNRKDIRNARHLGILQKWVLGRRAGIPDIDVDGRVRMLKDSDIPKVLEMLNTYRERVDIARFWQKDVLKWYLNWPPVSYTLVLDCGDIFGIINYHLIDACIYEDRYLMAEVDNLFLPHDQRIAAGFLAQSMRIMQQHHDVKLVSIYNTYYFDTGAMKLCNFMTYPRVLNFLGASYEADIDLRSVRSAYIDFR